MARVVYHLVPTSNHNATLSFGGATIVVYHLVPTSNHNSIVSPLPTTALFIILFLHQTTTVGLYLSIKSWLFIILFLHQTTTIEARKQQILQLFIILFLHQTTTAALVTTIRLCCLSSCSYIKPQHQAISAASQAVVYHLVPTSNHNLVSWWHRPIWLFIILFLHQTTTAREQNRWNLELFIILFLHQTTTYPIATYSQSLLFIILFLHQTTTRDTEYRDTEELFIILFLHQTTTKTS